MFPQFDIRITDEVASEERPRGKTIDFDFHEGEFVLRDGRAVTLSGVEALTVRIEKCLRTVAGRDAIYRQDSAAYGVNSFDLTNRAYPFAYLCAEIEREVTEALLKDVEILAVERFEFMRNGRMLEVSFVVESVYGEQEVRHEWLTV